MIIVNNTKELEQKFNLDSIPDDEMIQVLGGLAGKPKYNHEKYQRRVTYPARQLKKIILEMQEIERAIPPNWTDWQKAKYIYEILADNIDYNRNETEYSSQQSSNLTILLSKKGICAGYALLYKEMMDRQGIPCDYIRGQASTRNGKAEQHAWNVLELGGKVIGVDLTWDSNKRHDGASGLNYFGDDPKFSLIHRADPDERQYYLNTFSKESIENIPIDFPANDINQNYSRDMQISVIKYSITATYEKFRREFGEKEAIEKAMNAVYKYIKEKDSRGFTRDKSARSKIIENMNPDECMDLIIDEYVNQAQKSMNEYGEPLQYSVSENMVFYGTENTKNALKKYIVEGNSRGFTRNNDARIVLESNYSPDRALKSIISDLVLREIEKERNSELKANRNIEVMRSQYLPGDENAFNVSPPYGEKKYFSSVELAQVEPPKEKGMLSKAIDWMANKIRLKQNQKNVGDVQNQRKPNDYQR